MDDLTETIKEIDGQIERALWDFEVHDKLDSALKIYQDSEVRLEKLGVEPGDPAYPELQRVLSYCLMRQGNIFRQKGKPELAMALSNREIAAARASGDEITLARALMSNGTNQLVAGEIEEGLEMIEEARQLYEKGISYDHRQGLGWYWILQADLANARLIIRSPDEIIAAAGNALEILEPIENWPGVARAYAARAKAREALGEKLEADRDREAQILSESKFATDEKSTEKPDDM